MQKRLLSILLIIFVLFCCAGCTAPPTLDIDNLYEHPEIVGGNHQSGGEEVIVTPAPSASTAPAQPSADGGVLTVTFLDVGQGDSALLECGGEYMLIDGGEPASSSLLYSVLKNRGVEHLKIVVATHGHSDHVGGLSGALNYAKVSTAYCPVADYGSDAFDNFEKYLEKQGKTVTVPSAGETFTLGTATGTVVGPVKSYEDPNNTSIVLRVDYGETSFLFTGDMEETAEKDLIAGNANLDVDVLKVGHHGSETSTSYQFLREVMPEYAVISCGTDNPYGHPHNGPMSKLRDAEVTVYRTDLQGDITCVSDGQTLAWSVEKSASADELNPTLGEGSGQHTSKSETYIGNLNSQVYHLPTCNSLPKESNRIYFDSETEATDAGYRPCGHCKP